VENKKMRKLKLQMQMTLDGFVAGPNGESDWMIRSNGAKQFITSLIDSSDTLLMGRKMTDGFVNYWENIAGNQPESPEYTFAKKMVDTPKVVFSQTLDKSAWTNTVLAKGNLIDEIANLKNQNGKDLLVYGGADFVASLIKENLIDEYNLMLHPVILGKGLTIFDKTENRLNLKLIESKMFDSGHVFLHYAPRT
jgi:dihydrofolate reductase